MTPPSPSNKERSEAFGRLLAENAALCARQNIVVRVDRINADHSVAYCSVEQLHRGSFRRERSMDQLIGQAERALAPLRARGMLPLLSVQHKSLKNLSAPPARTVASSFMDRVRALWGRLGSPLAREGFSLTPLGHDPFGWRRAMNGSGPA